MASVSNINQTFSDSDSDDDLDDISDNVVSDSSDGDDYSDDDDDIDDVVLNPIWCDKTAGLKDIPFTGENKIKWPFPEDATPIDYFNVLLNIIFLEGIVSETNRYAADMFHNSPKHPKSRINRFKQLTVDELKISIGLLLHTGTFRTNRLQDYWKTHRLFNLPAFREYMSRDRFLIILRCLHFAKNIETPSDRLHKVRPIIDHFNNIMSNIYYPGKELSLDEAMVLWRGRLLIRQYIKGKRHKFGIKFYTLSEPNGLNLKFVIYSGKDDKFGGKDHTMKVVLHLLEGNLNRGHSIYMDNFYNSFHLASKLLSHDTYCTGTLRPDRKHNPKAVTHANLKKGETVAQYADGVMVGRWKDKRAVTYVSTEFENEMVTFVNNKTKKELVKPLPIIKYNAYMKGVDRADQMLAYYPCERKTLRWYKKIFIHVLQMLLVNGHILHNMNNRSLKKPLSLYDFRLQVIESLLAPSEKPQSIPRPKPTGSSRTSTHCLSKNEERDSKNDRKRKLCKVCYAVNKKRKFTTFVCSTCPDQPGLCAVDCFNNYHKNI